MLDAFGRARLTFGVALVVAAHDASAPIVRGTRYALEDGSGMSFRRRRFYPNGALPSSSREEDRSWTTRPDAFVASSG